jgi:hypothetical protein
MIEKGGAVAPSGPIEAVDREDYEMALIRATEGTRRLSTATRVLTRHIVARVRWGAHVARECIDLQNRSQKHVRKDSVVVMDIEGSTTR